MKLIALKEEVIIDIDASTYVYEGSRSTSSLTDFEFTLDSGSTAILSTIEFPNAMSPYGFKDGASVAIDLMKNAKVHKDNTLSQFITSLMSENGLTAVRITVNHDNKSTSGIIVKPSYDSNLKSYVPALIRAEFKHLPEAEGFDFDEVKNHDVIVMDADDDNFLKNLPLSRFLEDIL